MDQHTYRIIIEPDEKAFHAYVPALPGCHTFGKTIPEARKHIQEAMELYLDVLIEDGSLIPSDESFETFHTVFTKPKTRKKVKQNTRQYV